MNHDLQITVDKRKSRRALLFMCSERITKMAEFVTENIDVIKQDVILGGIECAHRGLIHGAKW